MTSGYKANNRHRDDGRTCHHFSFHRLTCDEYDALRGRAGGRCEICGAPEEDAVRGYLAVDHFQKGSIRFVRGLLCDRCNGGVMQCIDGRKVWGSNRELEAKAREYEANSWEKPSAEALEAMAARVEKLPQYRRRHMPPRSRINAIAVPTRRGVPAMAARLRAYLTPEELTTLAALLLNGGQDELFPSALDCT